MLLAVMFRSASLHLGWFVGSFGRAGRRAAPLSGRRLLFLGLGYPAFLALQTAHWAGLLLDEVLFRGYRTVAVERPLFVTGIPRSGTTFVHRTLAKDEARFTTVRTWEALLAPSVTERKLWKLCGAVDRALGGLGRAGVERVVGWLGEGLEDIHAVDVDEPEEDYLLLLPAGGCFFAALAFPFSETLWRLGRFDELPERDRRRLLAFYRACLQKHLYVEGHGRRLLSKNAAFGTWIPALRETFPDARFVACVRDPVTALSSQLSSVAEAYRGMGGRSVEEELVPRFRSVYAAALRRVEAETAPSVDDVAVVDQRELKEDPRAALLTALTELSESRSPELDAALREASAVSRAHQSKHAHDPSRYGLTLEGVGPLLSDPYAAISARTRTAAEASR